MDSYNENNWVNRCDSFWRRVIEENKIEENECLEENNEYKYEVEDSYEWVKECEDVKNNEKEYGYYNWKCYLKEHINVIQNVKYVKN